jgi:SAM-dependent methyltransferase
MSKAMTDSAAALELARRFAQTGQFAGLLQVCTDITGAAASDANALLDAGALLSEFGFIGRARGCFEQAARLASSDLRPLANLANLARDAGSHAEARRLYAALLQHLPDHPVVRRNALVGMEYDPGVSDADRFAQARAWGDWAVERAGGPHNRPELKPLAGRPLRIGYVSADFCQHTVGLFVKDVLAAHDKSRVTAFAYSARRVDDWVTAAIREACTFRDVSAMSDVELAEQIRQDDIDVLVDLSGHTAGSRLTAFAYRPAPVLVSWLGYFATTGLECMDAVLLDEWHAPPGTEAQFTEQIIHLPGGRFCYQPVSFAPEVAPLPAERKGHVTFGSFNNTAKLNEDVFDVWARVLAAVPGARLVLKWRTFNDEGLRGAVLDSFARRGIAADRIELRGPSFHAELLNEYADIDIALDPFPFTGGLTSCEALWMGVPVVTWHQERVVSRQTFALLSAIGLPELAAKDAGDYVRIAAELATDRERLAGVRSSLRQRMQASPLMNVVGFARQLEQVLIDLYRDIASREKECAVSAKTILHVGPGHPRNGAKLPVAFYTPEWREIRLDIDPTNEPDIVGSMMAMPAVADASVDAVYSAHNIEHVYAYEVPVVLKEFHRVLKPGGCVVVTCPDLQSVCALVAEDKLTDAAYHSPAGPISPLDILYGHGVALAAGHHFMAHKCGFTLKTLTEALQAAGFQSIAGKRRARGLDLWVVATKDSMEEAALRELALRILPE